jgi:hypothetical protein
LQLQTKRSVWQNTAKTRVGHGGLAKRRKWRDEALPES